MSMLASAAAMGPHVALTRSLGLTMHDHSRARDVPFAGDRRASAAERRARDRACGRMLGSDGRHHVVNGHLSDWESNPPPLGACSAAHPGRFAVRAELARPLGDRVFFAGKAAASHYFALCTGAYLSGAGVAARVADQLTSQAECRYGSCDARGRQRRRITGATE